MACKQNPAQAPAACARRRNAEVEAQIAALRAELLHREQEHARVQAALVKEQQERERAQRQVPVSGQHACSDETRALSVSPPQP